MLDYRVLYDATLATIEAGPLTYLELIAESLAARALAIHGIAWCRVTIRKPHVALGGPLSAEDIADCVLFAVTRRPNVNIDEIVVMALAQVSGGNILRES